MLLLSVTHSDFFFFFFRSVPRLQPPFFPRTQMATAVGILDLGHDALSLIFDEICDNSSLQDCVLAKYRGASRAWDMARVPLSQTCRRLDSFYRHEYVTILEVVSYPKSGFFFPHCGGRRGSFELHEFSQALAMAARILNRHPSVAKLSLSSSELWWGLASMRLSPIAVLPKSVTEVRIVNPVSEKDAASIIDSFGTRFDALTVVDLHLEKSMSQNNSCIGAMRALAALKTLTTVKLGNVVHAWSFVAPALKALPHLRALELEKFETEELFLEPGALERDSLPLHLDRLTMEAGDYGDYDLNTEPEVKCEKIGAALAAIALSSPSITYISLLGFVHSIEIGKLDWPKLAPAAFSLLETLFVGFAINCLPDQKNRKNMHDVFAAMVSLQNLKILVEGEFSFDVILHASASLPLLATLDLESRASGDPNQFTVDAFISTQGLVNLSRGPSQRTLKKLKLAFFPHNDDVFDRFAWDETDRVCRNALQEFCEDTFARGPELPRIEIGIEFCSS